jgi:elongator complex protein 4
VSGSSGGRENNIAFKCTRKRLVFETHHLDVEGGVGERRTVATTGTREKEKAVASAGGGAWMEVELEEGERGIEAAASAERKVTGSLAKKKRVTFRGEQRDLYDF